MLYEFFSNYSINNVYRHRQNIEIETAGFEVINGLLDAFINSVLDNKSKHHKKILELLPKQYLDNNGKPFADKYLNILNVISFISSMTDNYAINLYKTIKGHSLTTN